MGRLAGFLGALVLALALAAEAAAQAQDDWWEGEGESAEAEPAPAPEPAPQPAQPAATKARAPAPAAAATGEHEASDSPRVWYIGPWFRFMLVPAFFLELFLDEAPTVASPGFGLSATLRGDEMSFVLGLGYTSYAFEDAFRAKGDPELHTEWVDSSLGLLHATGSILWESELSRAFTFEYGVGADLGIVWSELRRTEAYPNGSDGWAPCVGVGNPDLSYCEPGPVAYDEHGAHYDVEEKRIPPVAILPMLPHLALRWTPAEHWAAKLEGAYGILQVWFGLSVAYAPKW